MKKSDFDLAVMQNFIHHITHSESPSDENFDKPFTYTPRELYALAMEYIKVEYNGESDAHPDYVEGLTREQLIRRFTFVREDIDNMNAWLKINNVACGVYNHEGCALDTYITNLIVLSDMDDNGVIDKEDMERVETEWITKAEFEAKNKAKKEFDEKKAKYDKIIAELTDMDVDGEMMQYIIEKTGMSDQMLRQLVLTNPQSDTIDLLEEHTRLSDNDEEAIDVNFPSDFLEAK